MSRHGSNQILRGLSETAVMDRKRYEKIVKEYGEALYRYCICLADGDRQLAEDTANDVWLVLLTKEGKLHGGKRIAGYLYSTAAVCMKRNKAIAYRIKKYELPLEVLDYMDPALPQEEEFFRDGRDEEDILREALEGMDRKDRELFEMRFIKKMTLREIAGATGAPYSTTRLHVLKLSEQVVKKIKEHSGSQY